MTKEGCPEEWRPRQCRHCQAQGRFHRHGFYTRKLYTLFEALDLVIFRFKCTTCERTFGLFPPFLLPYRGAALEVQEEVIRLVDQGRPLETITERLTSATEPYSAKTLWRWKKEWNNTRELLEPSFWVQVFTRFPHIRSPEGVTKTAWGRIFAVWQETKDELAAEGACCLQWLKYLARAPAVAV